MLAFGIQNLLPKEIRLHLPMTLVPNSLILLSYNKTSQTNKISKGLETLNVLLIN